MDNRALRTFFAAWNFIFKRFGGKICVSCRYSNNLAGKVPDFGKTQGQLKTVQDLILGMPDNHIHQMKLAANDTVLPGGDSAKRMAFAPYE